MGSRQQGCCQWARLSLLFVSSLLCEVSSARRNLLQSHHHHARGGEISYGPPMPHFCMRTKVFRIDDLAVREENQGWLVRRDFEKIITAMNITEHPYVTVTVDGIPCVSHECCQATLMIRPGSSSDVEVLTGIIDNYSGFLVKLLPWEPKAILEGGGNIGVATILLAHMYPQVPIMVLEPEPANCWLLQANTRTFSNVRVKCAGLWNKEANLSIVPSGDGRSWGWRTVEVPVATPDTIAATSVAALLQEYGLGAFEYYKLDIEGAEFAMFRGNAADSWLPRAKILSLEVHKGLAAPGELEHLTAVLQGAGFQSSTSGEYNVWAAPDLQRRIMPA